MRYVLIVLLAHFLSPSAMAQSVVYPESKPDSNRILVFLPDTDIPHPYKVSGEVVDGWATIYVNGIRIEPRSLPRVSAFPASKFDLCREGFSELQCEMQALGSSQDEVIEAVAERVRDCPGVVSVERDEIQLMVFYEDGSQVEYWVTEENCDLQKTVDWKVKRLQRDLNNGYAYLFTKTRDISVKPDEYEIFVSEIQAARDGKKAADSEWSFLTPELVRSIQQDKKK